MTRQATYENPSAGKWDAPPAPKDPLEHTPLHQRWWFGGLVVIAIYWARHWLLSPAGRAALGVIAPLLGITLLIVYEVMSRRSRARSKDDDPYTPPTELTR